MSNERKIYKPRPVTGFPEWLPEVRRVEQQWFDHIRRVFESYGFCNIETPSIEELDVLRAKGEVDKEIYVIERLHKDENDKSDARLALHFDQTVPLARYVAQNFNDLVFPFKRYQMQRVWRGERPQAGRFREFYQCDIDVIGIDNLPLHFDAEMPAIMWEVMNGLPGMDGEKIQIQISNRKIISGYLELQGLQATPLLSIIDKKEKMDEEEYLEQTLKAIVGVLDDTNLLLKHLDVLLGKKLESSTELHALKEWALKELKLDQDNQIVKGFDELILVMNALSHLPKGSIVADLSIVRGLDYYTGTVYETVFLDDPGYGSICSGGRYDDLAGSYISKHLPGVGISIGFSRLFARMLEKGNLDTTQKSPAHVMMILPAEERRTEISGLCQTLRQRGINVEMFHAAKKIPDQLKYASRKGIPYVWFPPFEEGGVHNVKNMKTSIQTPADPEKWKLDGEEFHEN